MSTADERLSWLESPERVPLLKGYDRFMAGVDNPHEIPVLDEDVEYPINIQSPLERATWVLNPNASHSYLAFLKLVNVDIYNITNRNWDGPYSDITLEGGVIDALWADDANPEETLKVAEEAASEGFELLRPIVAPIQPDDLRGKPFRTTPYPEHFAHDTYSARVNGYMVLYPSIKMIPLVIDGIKNNNYTSQEALFTIAALVGTGQSSQYVDMYPHLFQNVTETNESESQEEIRKRFKAQRHRFYDGYLMRTLDVAQKTHEQTVFEYLVGQKATVARLGKGNNAKKL